MTKLQRFATCPTCQCSGQFEFLGEQRWPVEIARKLGLPAVVSMWSCPNCQTTISEPDLLPGKTEAVTKTSLPQRTRQR